jgi:two-component system, cell cycle response regulator DivK
MMAARLSLGAISESSSIHLPPNEASRLANPVTFPFGRSSRGMMPLALKHIPIIVVTSYALGGDEAKALGAGCDSYMAKPYSPKALLAKVREYAS